MPRHIIGCMTGTSIDALDVALVRVEGEGLGMRAQHLAWHSQPLGETLTSRLRTIAEQGTVTAGEVAGVAHALSNAHVEAVRRLLAMAESAGVRKVDLAAAHGQTVHHAPPLSWQLFSAAPLAHAIGAPVVFDLRAADIARGGQGAPITPIADWVFFRSPGETRAVVNLGGFCNATLLPAGGDGPETLGAVRGFDVCACNQLLDNLARRLLNRPYDEDGSAAMSGQVNDEALEDLGGVLASQAGSRRSLGTGDEVGEWVSRFRARISPEDLAATACEGLGQAIARRLTDADPPPDRILLAGGGVRNRALVRAISGWASARVETTEAHGLPPEAREAAEIAVLGALCQDRVPITLPAVTGVPEPAPVAGAWVFP